MSYSCKLKIKESAMNCIGWMSVALLIQTAFAIGLATATANLKLLPFVRIIALIVGILLFGAVAYFYTLGWLSGAWIFTAQGFKSHAEWLASVIVGNTILSAIIAVWAWSMITGTVIASCCHLKNSQIVVAKKSLFGWIIDFYHIEHPNICAVSWAVGVFPVIACFFACLIALFYLIVSLAGIVFFIFLGKNPIYPFHYVNFNTDTKWPTVRIGKFPVIPILLISPLWLWWLIPKLGVMYVASLVAGAIAAVALVYVILYLWNLAADFFENHPIKIWRSKKAPQKSKPIIIEDDPEPEPRKINETLRKVILNLRRFFNTIRSWGDALKNRSCPIIIIEE